jgi:hypothetical protein
MRANTLRLIALIAVIAISVPAFAQWGHPLKGSWSGEWWLKKGEDNRILLEFDWDGKNLKGMLNPGTDNAALQKISLQPPPIDDVSRAKDPWLLQFEAEAKDSAGRVVRYVVVGKMENLGSYYRSITGTWTVGNQKGEFKIVRN